MQQISQHLKVERVLTDLRRVYQHFWTRLYIFRHRKVHRQQLADYKAENAPKVDGAALEEAKLAVVNAINALTVQEDNGTVTEPSAPAGGSTTDNSSNSSTDNGKAPQTGDNMLARVYACMAAAAAGIGTVIVGIRKKKDICER